MRLWPVLLLAASPALAEVDDAAILAQRPPKALAAFGFFDGDADWHGATAWKAAFDDAREALAS